LQVLPTYLPQFQQNKPIIYTLYEKILHLHFISRWLSSEKPWETLCNLQFCKQLKFKTFFACLETGTNFHWKRIAYKYWCNTNNPVHWFDQSELLIYIEDMWSFYTQNLWQNLASLVKYETNILTEKFVVETPTVSLTLKRQDCTFHQICPFHMDDRQQNSMVNKDPGSFLSQVTHRSMIIVHYCSLEQHKSGVLPLKPSKKA